jgi:hypothetical protein
VNSRLAFPSGCVGKGHRPGVFGTNSVLDKRRPKGRLLSLEMEGTADLSENSHHPFYSGAIENIQAPAWSRDGAEGWIYGDAPLHQ